MNEHIYNLIAKKLSGGIAPDEELELQGWLVADPEHPAVYGEYKQLWRSADDVLKAKEFDVAAAWDKVAMQTVKRNAKPNKGRVISIAHIRQSLAAVAAVLLIGVIVYRFWGPGAMEEIIADAGNREVVLPDDTHVTLHTGSKLRYKKGFAGGRRAVALEGEAYFAVHRDAQHPFTIDAQSALVRVLGTAFDVKCDKGSANVIVTEGSVRMAMSRDTTKFVILTRGDKGQLANEQLVKSVNRDPNFLYWKTGQLIYEDMPLVEIVAQLEEITGQKIKIDPAMPEGIQKQLVAVSFPNLEIENILSELCLVTNTGWKANGKNSYLIIAKQ